MYDSSKGVVVLRYGPTGDGVKLSPQELPHGFSRPSNAADHTAQFYLFMKPISTFIDSFFVFEVV